MNNKQQQNIELWVQFEWIKMKSNGIVYGLNESAGQQLLHIKTWFSCDAQLKLKAIRCVLVQKKKYIPKKER